MRILYVADTYETGGAFLSFMGLIGSITEISDDVSPVILTSQNGKTNEFANECGIENYSVGHRAFLVNRGSTLPRRIIRFFLRPVLKLKYERANKKAIELAEKYIDFSKIDVIHSNSDRNDIGAILAGRHNIPHVWHIREFADWDYDCFTLRNDYIAFMNEHADSFVAISHAVADRWIEKGLDSKKVTVVYNGVAKPQKKPDFQGDVSSIKGLIVGFVAPFKGQYDLIKAIGLLDKNTRSLFHLDIYGNGAIEYVLLLKLYVMFRGLQKTVCFKGYAGNITEIYKDYNVGFMCSKAEGFGRVTVEYLLNGLCVIASDTGANPELVEDGKTGYIYKYNDSNELANKIKHVVHRYEDTLVCAKNGYEMACELFTKEENARNIHNLYCRLVG